MGYNSYFSNDEYRVRSSINYYQNEIDSKENEINAIQTKIDRLVAVRDSIVVYKNNVREEKSRINKNKNDYSESTDWNGSRHDRFMSEYCDTLIVDYKAYYDQIDCIHDALNNEIARLQNSIYEKDGILGWLRARLNDCWTWLNNLTN